VTGTARNRSQSLAGSFETRTSIVRAPTSSLIARVTVAGGMISSGSPPPARSVTGAASPERDRSTVTAIEASSARSALRAGATRTCIARSRSARSSASCTPITSSVSASSSPTASASRFWKKSSVSESNRRLSSARGMPAGRSATAASSRWNAAASSALLTGVRAAVCALATVAQHASATAQIHRAPLMTPAP